MINWNSVIAFWEFIGIVGLVSGAVIFGVHIIIDVGGIKGTIFGLILILFGLFCASLLVAFSPC